MHFLNTFTTQPNKKKTVVGCGCSTATEPVAEINHLWNITQVRQQHSDTIISASSDHRLSYIKCYEVERSFIFIQISYATGVAVLSDRSRFRYCYRMTPTFTNNAPAILGVMNKFNWRRLGFITQNQNLSM